MAYGGDWTEHKLEILRGYLDNYTTALKNKPFQLMYVDAFAGTGTVESRTDDRDGQNFQLMYVDAFAGREAVESRTDDLDGRKFIDGSTRIAASISDKPFDKLIFLEKDPKQCDDLKKLKDEPDHKGRDIEVENTDANIYLRELCLSWKDTHANWRGVLFLDPFATQVEWKTVEAVASTQALDTWIWFPVGAISRMLPRGKRPDPKLEKRLTRIFGDESWKTFYHDDPQQNLFDETSSIRNPGVQLIRNAYKEKLRGALGNRLLGYSKPFANSKNVVLFDLIFCAGNERGIKVSHKIAKHLLEKG